MFPVGSGPDRTWQPGELRFSDGHHSRAECDFDGDPRNTRYADQSYDCARVRMNQAGIPQALLVAHGVEELDEPLAHLGRGFVLHPVPDTLKHDVAGQARKTCTELFFGERIEFIEAI